MYQAPSKIAANLSPERDGEEQRTFCEKMAPFSEGPG